MSTARIITPDATSLAPVTPWSGHQHPGHVVQFYADDAFLLDGLSRFIGTALGAGDAAIVIATKAHRDGLEQRLRARGLDTARAIHRGRYVPLDAAETLLKFMRNGSPDAACFAETIGTVIDRAKSAADGAHPQLAAFGEMVALLWSEEKCDAAIQLEHLWNDLLRTHSFAVRCAYPMSSFYREEHAEPFLNICAEHSEVIPADSYTGLTTNEQRLRNIVHLQQKEQAHEELLRAKKQLENEVAERMEAERKLQDSESSLRALSGRLLRMQDEERRHLGRELHDSIGQYLAVLKLGLDMLTSEVAGEVGQQLADCRRLAEQSIKEVRTMSYLLYPPMLEEMGLETAIPWYLEGFSKRSGIQIGLEIPCTFGRLPRDAELAIFRVLQESLTNVHRHSGSATAQVRLLVKDGTVDLEIKDQGKGIPASILESTRDGVGTLGVGLRGMSERMRQLGGKLELFSSNQGTTVSATLVCDPE